MTGEDALVYRTALVTMLSDRGFGWIVAQAEEKLSLGKATRKRVDSSLPARTTVTGELRKASRGKFTEFVASEPYTEVEKLSIILDAIELGLVSPVRMEDQIPENLVLPPISLRFAVDGDSLSENHEIDLANRASRREFARKLALAIAQLRAIL